MIPPGFRARAERSNAAARAMAATLTDICGQGDPQSTVAALTSATMLAAADDVSPDDVVRAVIASLVVILQLPRELRAAVLAGIRAAGAPS